jgi:ATP-dependent DNA ligase
MDLPVMPPLEPMLARLVRTLPRGDFRYEPKWDGFRCLAFRDGDEVDLRSRHDRPLGRYFPELVAGIVALPAPRLVLDGEIVLAGPDGFDFARLMGRLHPAASRVARLAAESPAAFVAFDLIALDERDLRGEPFAVRRSALEEVFARPAPPILLTPATADAKVAEQWFERFRGAGVDGVMAKPAGGPYEAGRRAMTKVKRERTADCVVAGMRLLPGGDAVSSILLGLHDTAGVLRHVGVVTQFPGPVRREVAATLAPLSIALEEHPWRGGFAIGASPLGRLKGSAARWTPEMPLDWVPLSPERVVEVGFDQVDVDRFRHPARFRRWRPDRTPGSCRLDQIEVETEPFTRILGLG